MPLHCQALRKTTRFGQKKNTHRKVKKRKNQKTSKKRFSLFSAKFEKKFIKLH